MEDLITPAEMAEACDVTIDTLRYYEREGLLHAVGRTSGNQRRYRADDVAWVQVLRCLRVTDMPIRDMRTFAELVRAGDAAIPERMALLEEHRRTVVAQIERLHEALATIDHKIEAYAERLAADGTPAVSPDIAGQARALARVRTPGLEPVEVGR